MPVNFKKSTGWAPATGVSFKKSAGWVSASAAYIKKAAGWVQVWPSARTYTFAFGNTVHVGTNGYISLDEGQSAVSISSTVGRVLGILPADLVMNSVRWAASGSRFYVFWRGKRFSGGTDFEIEYEVHFISGQDYALIKLVSFPSSTYANTAYYVDGSRTGYSAITSGRTVGAEYRVYFGTTSAFATSFTEFGTSTDPVWLASSSVTSGSNDDGYFSIVANQGSSSEAPTSVTASSITGTSATISWTAPLRESRGMSAIQSYDYSINSGGSWTSTGANTSVNLTGLSAGTSYTVLVRANNYFFTGTNYGSVTFSTTSVLTPPSIFFVSAGNSSSQPVSVYFSGGSGPNYQMWWQSSASTPSNSVTPDAFGSSSPLTDNTGPSSAGTWYAFVRSVAVNDGSTVPSGGTVPSTTFSQWSSGFSFTVTQAPIIPTITSLTATSITTTSATISWSSTNQASYSISGGPFFLTGSTATSVSLGGLSANTSYTITVIVTSSTGDTASATHSFTTLAVQYTVTWNANGGTGGGSTTQNAGVAHTAPSPGTRSGFTFSSYNDTPSGDFLYGPIASGGSFTPPSSITMYARWAAIVPNVTQITALGLGNVSAPYIRFTFTSTNAASLSIMLYRSAVSSTGPWTPLSDRIIRTTSGTVSVDFSSRTGTASNWYYVDVIPYFNSDGTGTAGTLRTSSVRRGTQTTTAQVYP
jgi:hypothetical protein